jgi:hypothetical protein
MREPIGCKWQGFFVFAFLAATATAATAVADEPKLADYFGFLPLEVYKLDPRIGGLLVKDLDGDKIDDVIVHNNGRSRIELLLSRKKGAAESAPVFPKSDVNQLSNDNRMRQANISVNKEVVSIQAGDFNGDGKNDLAFFGNPSELVVLYNDGNGRFDMANSRKVKVGDAIVESASGLTVGDLNRDGKDDLALLGNNELVLVYQLEKGKLSEPERLPHTATGARILKAVDIDGDGGDDLVILDGSPEHPFRIRFSAGGGKLGPEQRFAAESTRAIAFAPVDTKPGSEILTIENQSGRVKVLSLDEAESDDGGQRGRLIFYPFPPGNERGRSVAVGDLDGDGKADVVVTDPANAQFLLYRQGKGGLGTSQTFPGLVGGKTVKLADFDGDGKAEIIVLSEQEKQIGRSTLTDNRITFPAPLPLSGEPVALDVADLNGDKTPEVVYVSRIKDKSGSEEYALRALTREKAGNFIPFRWGPEDDVPLKNLTGAPPAIRVVDVNHDGQADIFVFNSFGPPTILLGRADEPPAPSGSSLGPMAGVTPTGLSLVNLDGPAIIVSQNTFARNLVFGKDGRWEVKDHYNSDRPSAQIVGASAIDTDGDGKKEIVLLDRSSKSLMFLDSREGVYRPGGTISFGPLDYQGMHVADLDGDGRDDLLVAGTDKFGVVITGRKGQRLKTIASYESSRTDAHLTDLIAGDLNADGHLDIVITDAVEHYIEIVTCSGQPELDRGLSFKVLERKSFRGGGDPPEPRDLFVGDVDGDGRTDLILQVNDRILIYRQDPGEKAEEANKGK